MLVEDSPPAAADRWMAAAFELACAEGLAALSARALAARTGGSPSAINYYFGNRRMLIAEVSTRAAAASEQWRQAHHDRTKAGLPVWMDLAGAFTAILHARLTESHRLLALLRELEQEAIVSKWDDVTQMMAAEQAAEALFWEDLAAGFGARPMQAELWAHLALALTTMCLSLAAPAQRSIWIATPAQRLQQRLARAPIILVPDDARESADFEASPPRYNETAYRILDAALGVIADKGADRLTQREVAAAAGVSLSAVTYFFGAKHDLIEAAFNQLCRREYRSIQELARREEGSEDALLTLGAAHHSGMLGAIDVLMRAALRQPTLAGAVDRMLAIRGIGSAVLLRKLGLPADRLDGYLWISMVSGAHRRFYNLPIEARAIAMQGAGERRLMAMFGSSPVEA